VTHRTRKKTWIALIAWLVLALVPGPGFVMCMTQDGGLHLGLGAHGDCPCPPLPDGSHPPCVDIVVDGQRDLLPPDLPLPELLPTAWLALAAAIPLQWLSIEELAGLGARAGPRPPGQTPPFLHRALDERAAVVLQI
jgi:hypothetical protein